MRAISQYTNFAIQIVPQAQQGLGDGTIRVTREPIYARFDPDGMMFENEIERAERSFSFRGRTQHVDEATPTEIISRLSVLDTETQGWDEETREKVEAELRRLAPITPDDFFIVEDTPLGAPFPAWDSSEKKPYELVTLLQDLGYDLHAARAYELNFGPKREELIEAIEDAIMAQEGAAKDEVEIEA